MAFLRNQGISVRNIFHKILALCVILLMWITGANAEVLNEHQIERSLPGDGVSLVKVKAISGIVRLTSWEKTEVLVKAFKKVRADSSEEAQEYSNKVEIQIERVDDRVEVKTDQPRISGAMLLGKLGIWVDYDIFVPEDINFDVKNENGSVYIIGIRGEGKVNTVNGSIELKNMAGSVSAETVNGDIRVEALFDAESSFATVSGSIDIRIGDSFSVPISARTVSGSVNVTIPEGFSADVDAGVLSGQANCDFPLDGAVKNRSVKGKIFGGGPLMKLRTINGDITISASEEWVEAIPESEQEPIQAETEETPEELEIPFQKLEQAPALHVEAVKTLDSPVIDGRLDEDCWKRAGKIENFVWADGTGKPHEPTEAYILWDDRNLYIGVKCYESSMDTIRISNIERDKEDWEDDVMQIFIDATPETEEGYYHIAVNPIGTVFDQEIERARQEERKIKESESTSWHLIYEKLESRRLVRSKLGIKWNSGGLVDTDIRSDLWSIEMAIPFSALHAEPETGDVWCLNLYRMEQRIEEHTYWSPVYTSDRWAHVPARFGELAFTAEKLVREMPEERPTPSEEALTISHIAIQGNKKVSQEEILSSLELKPGDLADVDSLSQAKLRLEALGWFRNVGMDLTENDKGVDLVVKVVEKEIISVSETRIDGSALFTEKQIVDYFNFGPFTTTKGDVDIKCKLIERLYKSKGNEMAAADCSVVSNTLIINIDEGSIDKIEVRGNNKVRTRDIMDSLDLKPGMPYERGSIDNAINTMKARLPYFQKVTWKPGRSVDGSNIVYIDVEEQSLTKASVDGTGEFNRVHGLQWGLKAEVRSTYGGSRGYCKFLYGFSSEIWDYQFGMEKSWFRKHRSTIGIDVHRITDTSDWELVSDAEHFIAEAILGEAWRDFYQRKGYELNFGQKLTPSNEFGIRYRDDEYESLRKTSDWSLLDRSYSDDDWYDEFRWTGGRSIYSRTKHRFGDDDKYKPENPPIEEGRMKSVIAEYTIDTRNSKKDPSNGWLNTFSVEYAGRDLGGDYDFTIYKADIRRYNRLSGNQFLTFRVKAAKADRALPDSYPDVLHPRRFYLGGIGTLRGYQFKEFAGDEMLLLNAEYWVMTKWPPGLGIVFFADSGYAWPYESEMDIDDMKTDLGVGFQLDGLRINLASPINEKDEETDFVLSARLARMF